MSEQSVQANYDEANRLYKEARAQLEEYDQKPIPADVQETIDRKFKAGDEARKTAELWARNTDVQRWQGLAQESKRLDAPEVKSDVAVEEEAYARIFEKYNLHKWQVRDVKDSIKSINYAFTQSKRIAAEKGGYQYKALAETAATSGSTLTPDIFVPEFVNKLYLQSHLRQAGCRVLPLRSDITRVPQMTTASGAASLVAEAGAFTATNATVNEVVFTAHMLRALEQASIEIVADAEFDLLGTVILPDMAQSFAAAENSYFTVGTGTNAPYGLVTACITSSATVAVTYATSQTTPNFDDMINLMHKVPPQYRNSSCKFMLNDAIIAKLRGVKAVSAGTYIWEPSQQAGAPDRLYGFPVIYNQTMTASLTAGTYPILFGNFDYFWIGDRGGLELVTANELYLANAQIGYFGYKRTDSQPMQIEAFSILKGG